MHLEFKRTADYEAYPAYYVWTSKDSRCNSAFTQFFPK